jgi:hypothetical protein
MTNENTASLEEVFYYIQDVYKQCQSIAKDTADSLRKETQCYFEHKKEWDFSRRPGEHFLSRDFFATSKVWLTYVPVGNLDLAALLYFQFFHSKLDIQSAMMYGSLAPLEIGNFEDIDRHASYRMIRYTEEGWEGFDYKIDGKITIVTSTKENHFPEAHLVRVPLESIRGTDDLNRIVIKPLSELLKGNIEKTRELLDNIDTIEWPILHDVSFEEDEEEIEQA